MAIQQVAADAFGNALGSSLADAIRPQSKETESPRARETQARNVQAENALLYGLDSDDGGMGLRLGGGSGLSYGSLRAGGLSVQEDSYGDDGLSDLPAFDLFESGPIVAGPGGAPSQLIKVGASAEWRRYQESVYSALDDLNAAVSMGGQDPARLAELRGSLDALNSLRIDMQTDPSVMREILDRSLTFTNNPRDSQRDLERVAMLGAFGDTNTVQRIAVATANAGGVGRASAQGIADNLNELGLFTNAQVNAMRGDAGVLASAPGVYLNTLLDMRSHVDSTMLYIASMSGEQMAQLGSYTEKVMDQGGMTRYQDNEKLAGMFSSMQATGAGIARVGEGLSVVGMGLRNFASSLGQSIGNMNPDILVNSTVGRMLSWTIGPMYVVPRGYSVAYEMKLNPQDYGKSAATHNKRAAESLRASLAQDPEQAAMMEALGVKLGTKSTPQGWTWEHASSSAAAGQTGVMRLVPRNQHTPGSDWWRVIHPDPGAAGGYAEWARPAGAPKR
ncbi:hypothetical protein EAG14_10185 [Acidovorax sp. 1608163]|uniref:HNH endonuclease n=1 Tax=Acidovorax sp. 1608163 TaxID=2478662 RepID=UPI000EF7088F|nr:HNH endonuclease [Acidovorax sp. 1608163]AYM96376.1 hypothetical protein EAG14_10185 [Acidovorax sp. 1608163]